LETGKCVNDEQQVRINGSFDFDSGERNSDLMNSIKNVYVNKYTADLKKSVAKIASRNGIRVKEQDSSKICKRSIERWIRQGVKRKKGAGRKTVNPQMEATLVDWAIKYLNDYSIIIRETPQAQGNHKPGQELQERGLQGLQGLVRQVSQAQLIGLQEGAGEFICLTSLISATVHPLI
jgi:hypothetical protein